MFTPFAMRDDRGEVIEVGLWSQTARPNRLLSLHEILIEFLNKC